jgi:hypothetical protein
LIPKTPIQILNRTKFTLVGQGDYTDVSKTEVSDTQVFAFDIQNIRHMNSRWFEG